jgi:hypothetical protein
MTDFDTKFNEAAEIAELSWVYVLSNQDRNTTIDSKQITYPCIFRSFSEPTKPLFDMLQRYERDMSLYIVAIGFQKATTEQISEDLEDIMARFVILREELRRRGIEIEFKETPFPNWEKTEIDEYGIVFNVTAKYTICQ